MWVRLTWICWTACLLLTSRGDTSRAYPPPGPALREAGYDISTPTLTKLVLDPVAKHELRYHAWKILEQSSHLPTIKQFLDLNPHDEFRRFYVSHIVTSGWSHPGVVSRLMYWAGRDADWQVRGQALIGLTHHLRNPMVRNTLLHLAEQVTSYHAGARTFRQGVIRVLVGINEDRVLPVVFHLWDHPQDGLPDSEIAEMVGRMTGLKNPAVVKRWWDWGLVLGSARTTRNEVDVLLVRAGSPAKLAGWKVLDIIKTINQTQTPTPQEFWSQAIQVASGSSIKLAVQRAGRLQIMSLRIP